MSRVEKKGEGKTRLVRAGDAWMGWPNRSEADHVTYEPGQSRFIGGNLNVYRPSTCEPSDGDITAILRLIEFLIPVMGQRKWAMQWLAFPLIYLGAKLSTALVLYSRVQGVGKSTVADVMRNIYGQQNCSTITETDLDSQFNDYLYAKQLVVCEEITAGGKEQRARADRLKHIITGSTVRLNEKWMPKVELPNKANMLFNTNHNDAFSVSNNDRRLGIMECIADTPLDAKYYTDLRKLLANGGVERFYGHLLRQDVSDFNPHGHAPSSEAKSVMIEASRSVLAGWIHDLKTEPDALVIHLHSFHRKLLSLHTADELLSLFDGGLGRCTTKAMALALRSEGFKMANGGEQIRLGDDEKKRLWITRNSPQIVHMDPSQIAGLYHRERSSKARASKFAVVEGGKSSAK